MTTAPRFAECSHKAEGPESTHVGLFENLPAEPRPGARLMSPHPNTDVAKFVNHQLWSALVYQSH
jgi:hypothetical protein